MLLVVQALCLTVGQTNSIRRNRRTSPRSTGNRLPAKLTCPNMFGNFPTVVPLMLVRSTPTVTVKSHAQSTGPASAAKSPTNHAGDRDTSSRTA